MVPPAVHLTTAHIAAVPDPYADISDKTLQAYKAYKAAITDPPSSCADLARLTGDLQEERQADRECARSYHMPDDEAAVLAAAAGRDYDSDDEGACASTCCACSWMCLACPQCSLYATGGLVHISHCAISICVSSSLFPSYTFCFLFLSSFWVLPGFMC